MWYSWQIKRAYAVIVGECLLVTLFAVLWITKPQHVDKVITKTVTVPAQFQYKVGESVMVYDSAVWNGPTWLPGTVTAINNDGNEVQYIVNDTSDVQAYTADQMAKETK